jgi:HSF-type DNA-binding
MAIKRAKQAWKVRAAATCSRAQLGDSQMEAEAVPKTTTAAATTTTRIESYLLVGCEALYRDYSNVPMEMVESHVQWTMGKRKGPRGGVADPFPVKLYTMLCETGNTQTQAHIVSWQASHGRSFAIHHAAAFVNEIMPRYEKLDTSWCLLEPIKSLSNLEIKVTRCQLTLVWTFLWHTRQIL